MVREISLLLFISTVFSPVLCCDWLAHYGHLSDQSLSLIKLMGGPLTKQESPVSFPKKLYRRAHNATVDFQLAFIRDSFNCLNCLWLKLYDPDNVSSVTWGTTLTEHFLMTILRQEEELKRCVSRNRQEKRRLAKYYQTLETRTLTHKANRTESWELIRRETKLHLDQLHMLVASIITRQQPVKSSVDSTSG